MNLFSNFPSQDVLTHVSERSQDFTLADGQVALTPQQQGYLEKNCHVKMSQVYYGRQVHGDKIVTVSADDVPLQGRLEEADGFMTKEKGIALAVRTADCLPLFLYDPKKQCVGLIHAGWKGSDKRIAIRAVASMISIFGCEPSDILAGFGPAIRSCCYEVGKEFKAAFPKDTVERKGAFFFDLVQTNRRQLLDIGIMNKNIMDTKECTCCNKKYFSYRRDGKKAGRHLSLIMLKNEK